MGHLYSIELENEQWGSVGSDVDVFTIKPAADRAVVVHSVWISNVDAAAGLALEKMFAWAIRRGYTTGGNGTAVTPVALSPGAPAAGAACQVKGTTAVSAGSPVTLHTGSFNSRGGLVYIPTPTQRPIAMATGEYLAVRIVGGSYLDLEFSGALYFEEM